MHLAQWVRSRSLTDEDCHRYLLASMSFNQGSMPMKFAPKLLVAALCLGLAGQVLATDLKHWPADQAKEGLPVTADKNWVVVTPQEIQ